MIAPRSNIKELRAWLPAFAGMTGVNILIYKTGISRITKFGRLAQLVRALH